MSRPPKNRPYQRHGLYVLKGALSAVGKDRGWLESLGDTGENLRAWRDAIIADLGGEDAISAQERVVVEAATTTYLLLSSVDRFLLEQESLVNKSRRKLFPVVLERQRLADALVRYLDTLGLGRRVREAPDLRTYLAQTYDNGRAAETSEELGPELQDGPEEERPAELNTPRSSEEEDEGSR